MSRTRDERRVVTFYGFKGGVGCTMSVANVAWRLAARHGLRVVVVDWDLEAPSLHDHLGLHGEAVASARGVLDFLTGWMDSVEQRTEEIPDVGPWLLRMEGPSAPPNGSLSLLLAGRLDDAYGDRVVAFDWARFYQDIASSVAIETLRAQLLEAADVVLVDCRAGLHESTRACTGLLADGVALMSLASEQSVAGVERVARSLATPGVRPDGRPAPRVWLTFNQVPEHEEGALTRAWFKRWRTWFEACARDGLWRWEDHPGGITSHRLPHRARWAFGDSLVLDEPDAIVPDPLVEAYDRLAATLFEWSHGDLWGHVGDGVDPGSAVEALRRDVRDAERRRDVAGVSRALMRLAMTLFDYRRIDEAASVAERSAGIEMGRGNHEESASRMLFAATALRLQRRYPRVIEVLDGVLATPRATPYGAWIAAEAAVSLEQVHRDRGDVDAATAVAAAARAIGSDVAPTGRRRRLRAVNDARARTARADFSGAWSALDRELRGAVEGNDPVLEARVVEAMAEVRFRQMRFETALSFARQAMALDKKTGRWGEHAAGLCFAARCERRLGRFDKARALAEEALAVARRCESAWCEAAAVLELGVIHLARGQFDDASLLAQRALALAAEGAHRECEAAALRTLARVRMHELRTTEARALLEHALRTAREAALGEVEASVLRDVADVLVLQQNEAQAVGVLIESARMLRTASARVEELAVLQSLRPMLDDAAGEALATSTRIHELRAELGREGVEVAAPSLGAYA